ncbi:MAG: helix-turn-helix transcriptional regulator [Treponema sp.]|jgi:transcriptional regulator with XRE-family HTH domain|nr:helix-turn-helix transcriptional regulator [Treponema sp.]
MANLRQLLALTMKKRRRDLGLSQAALAERADTSTQYVAMIELARKFPSPEMLERIAAALEIDAPELFSLPPSPAGTLRRLHEAVLADIEQAVAGALEQTIKETVGKVIAAKLKELEGETQTGS